MTSEVQIGEAGDLHSFRKLPGAPALRPYAYPGWRGAHPQTPKGEDGALVNPSPAALALDDSYQAWVPGHPGAPELILRSFLARASVGPGDHTLRWAVSTQGREAPVRASRHGLKTVSADGQRLLEHFSAKVAQHLPRDPRYLEERWYLRHSPSWIEIPNLLALRGPTPGRGGGIPPFKQLPTHAMLNGSSLDSKEVKSGSGWTRAGL